MMMMMQLRLCSLDHPSEHNTDCRLDSTVDSESTLLYGTYYLPIEYDMIHTIARFIWNAEISVSVAIHCYEHLF